MEEVYKQMKKYEILNQPKINLGESAKRMKHFLEEFLFRDDEEVTDAPSSSRKQNLRRDPDLDPSVLACPDEVFYKFRSSNPIVRSTKTSLSKTFDQLKCLQPLRKKKTEKNSQASNTSKKIAGRKKANIASNASKKIAVAKNLENASKNPKKFAETKSANEASNHRKIIQRTKISTKDYHMVRKPMSNPENADLLSGEEFVLTVRVFLPFHYKQLHHKSPGRRTKFQTEILILGSQTLLDLREVIFCIEDYRSTDGDVSNNPIDPSGRTYKDRYPSSMFFIDDTFYVDYTKQTDYSIVVKEWAQTHNIPLNQETKDMTKTHIRDLNLKLNYPYLFQHLGDCEHLIQFLGARILDGKRSSLCSSDYPMYTQILKVQGHLCMMCRKCYPAWIVVGYSRLPNQYSFLCKVCFKNYCYIGDKKIGSFKAFHFVDSRALNDY